MELDKDQIRQVMAKDLTEVLIRVGIIAALVYLSLDVFSPFIGLVLWGLILAVTLYPLHQRLAAKIGNRQGWAATLLVLVGLLLIGVPTMMLGMSFADRVSEVHGGLQNHSLEIPLPPASVEGWPFIGEKLFAFWSLASHNLPALLEDIRPELAEFSKKMLAIVASTAGGVFKFLGSLIIAGIMMAYGKSGAEAMSRIICRLAGKEKGPGLYSLSTATIRSVSMGVVGVAFIQALLLGLGFMAAGVPGAGVLAILVLIIGILQLPALLISLPVIAYLWSAGGDSTMMSIVFTVYLLIAGAADNVLKPLLLGRGVDAPMPIILLGALGGMVSAGLIGLFVGAVVLALAYVIFMAWVAEGDDEPCEPTATEEPDMPAAIE